MKNRTRQKFIALGLSTTIINKCDAAYLTLSSLKGLSKSALIKQNFTQDESDIISAKVNRIPIASATLQNILSQTDGVCCYCGDGISTRPYQIHHIIEYYLTQDNSEDNLLLVCPTHHVAIHSNNISELEQKTKRMQWQNMRSIADAYLSQGIIFPFGAFSNIPYVQTPDVTEVFEFSSPSPATCLSVLDQANKQDATRILNEENRLIITGASGSGKTTFAIGIAGSLEGLIVYSYAMTLNATNAVAEILAFCAFATKSFVLILDNANAHLSESQIESILQVASPFKKLIIIQTTTSQINDNNLEEHFLNSTYHISWTNLKRGIKSKMLAHEHEVISYLQTQQLDSGSNLELGEGKLDRPLAQLIDNYGSTVETAYQFFFLFASGTRRIDKLQTELATYYHLDVILLLIAINQIGRVERGTSLFEISEQYRTLSIFKDNSFPTEDWVKEQLERLQKKRIIKNERGHYNTVHREFARRFIEHCFSKRKAVTCELLQEIFDNPLRVSEIAPLWSWLKGTIAHSFIHDWSGKLGTIEWQALTESACDKGLAVLSLLADQMLNISFNTRTNLIGAFDGRADQIASLINQDSELHIYYLRRLISSLHQLQPEMIREILVKTDKEVVTSLIKNVNPVYFDDVTRLFSQINEHFPEWIKEMSGLFANEDFEAIMDRIEPGGVDELQAVVTFQREFIHDIKKSQYLKYTAKFASLIRNCPLKDIRYSGTLSSGFWEIHLFPEEINKILAGLNADQLSTELSDCLPRDWDNLAMLAILSGHVSTSIFEEMIEKINIATLKQSIGKYYRVYHYELRVFFYLLSYGRAQKRKAIANTLRPFVTTILTTNDLKDSNDVFKAFFALDEDTGISIARELMIPIPEKHEKFDFSIWDEFKKELKDLESKDQDYRMSRIRKI